MVDLLGLRTHIMASGHAYNSLYKMTRPASGRSMYVSGCLDHTSTMLGACRYCHSINSKVIPRTLYDIKLMMGIELSIMNHERGVDLEQDLLQNLGYTIASLHHPCIENDIVTQSTNVYLDVMKNPTIHIVGHPDNSRYPIDHSALVSAARGHEALLEVSNSSLDPMGFHQGVRKSYLKMLELHRHYKAPVVVNSDAHYEADSGDHAFTRTLLEEVSFPPEPVMSASLGLLVGHIPRLTSILAQSDDARCDRTDRDTGDTTSAGDTASAGNTASAGGMGKQSIS